MRKFIYSLIIFIGVFFVFTNINSVEAFVAFKSDLDWIDGSCLDKNKCIALCSYYQTAQNTPAQGVSPTTYYSGVYIYYYFNGDWQISWDKGYISAFTPGGKTVTRKGDAGSSDDAFDEYIFMQGAAYKDLVNNSVCPKYAYVDTGGGDSEVCFDNNGTYCDSKNGWATTFTSDKKSEHSDYDISNDLKYYFDNYSPNFDDCTSLDACNLDKIKEQFTDDFKKNYLKGNNIPKIIQNNQNYKDGLKKVTDEFKKLEEKLKEQIDNDSSLTETEKENKKEEIDNTISGAQKEFEETVEEMSQPQVNYNEGISVSGCEVIPEVIRKWINNILSFVRYVALALVIALGALDFMKAAGSGEPDAMKKAGQSFMKRMIAVVVLFLLPVIVDFILNMINIYGVDPNNVDCL